MARSVQLLANVQPGRGQETGGNGAWLVQTIDDCDDEDVPIRRPAVQTRPDPTVPTRGPKLATFAQLERGEIESFIVANLYRVDRYLGRGGMASLYGGEHLDSGRRVAVKVLSESAEELRWDDALPRFIQEAKLGRRVRHANVVDVMDWGTTPEGVVYLVMELLRGEDLRSTLERRKHLPWSRARKLMLQLCEGLTAVHRAGIVHRDLKPSNCFRVVEDGEERLKLVDFGVATLSPQAMAESSGVHDRLDDGAIIGTPEYMSPEQARGDKVDARSDVYSAGLILCEVLTGTTPFRGQTRAATLAAQVHEQPASLRQLAPGNMDIDPRLELVFARALAKHPRDRFATIEEFAAALESIPARRSDRISGVFTDLPRALAALEQGGEPSAREAEAREPGERRTLARTRRPAWRALAVAVAVAVVVAVIVGSSCVAFSQPEAFAHSPEASATS